MLTDDTAQLIRKATGGDSASFAEIARRYIEPLRRVCYLMLHSSVGAEDAVQQTFAHALKRLDQYRSDGSPRSWLYSIAMNVCRRRLRDESRRETSAGSSTLNRAKPVHVRPRGVLTSILGRETDRQISIALGYLSETQREVFVLHYVEELPYEEISGIVGVTPPSARVLAHRARAILREHLKNSGL